MARSTLEPSSETHLEIYNYGRAQFVNEARTLAQFSDPNIVPIYRFLEANETAYLVMNYEEGYTLARVLKRSGKIDQRKLIGTLIRFPPGVER